MGNSSSALLQRNSAFAIPTQNQNYNMFTDAVGTENCFMIINLKLFLDNNYVKTKIYLFEFGKKYSCFHKGKANEKTEYRNKSKTFLRWKMAKTKIFLAFTFIIVVRDDD